MAGHWLWQDLGSSWRDKVAGEDIDKICYFVILSLYITMKAKIKDHYNQALVVLRKKYGVDAKSNVELQKICQVLKLGTVPVVPWDQYKGEKRAIVNTDDHRKKGTHWVAVFRAGKTNLCP